MAIIMFRGVAIVKVFYINYYKTDNDNFPILGVINYRNKI